MLSSILFILYTNECRSTQDNCHVIKYVDGTIFLSLLSSSKCDDSQALNEFIMWCSGEELLPGCDSFYYLTFFLKGLTGLNMSIGIIESSE